MKKQTSNPFWGAGETKDFGKVAIEYAAGEDVVLDQQLVQYECLVNQAHVVMLFKQGLISHQIAKALLKGLEEIKQLDKQAKFELKKELEDVHSNVEKYLINKLGIAIGGYLRLGIARNDQVYTDTRLWLKDQILIISDQLIELISGLVKLAKKHVKTIMPGYTHLRISQPITYAHWLTAKTCHFLDDLNNILATYEVIDQCPLGIFEMAGTHLNIDRQITAKLLGFKKPTPNSLYTANQRGELEIKVLADFSLLALHIRRTMSEVIIFSTHEFGLMKIDDLYTTGGTAQPNLKNPDTLEVIRANMAKMIASLIETLMIMDPLPSGFNRDTQQTKPILFLAVATMIKTLPVFSGIMTSLVPNKKQMNEVANLNFATAPDIAVQICVKGGVSFREAYKVVKALIKDGYLKKSFEELTPAMVAEASFRVLNKKLSIKQVDIDMVATAEKCAWSHTSEGGPAPSQVKKQIHSVTRTVAAVEKQMNLIKAKQKQAFDNLGKEVKQIIGGV